jgi:hypothetical protein
VLDHGANVGILDFAVMDVYADFVTDFELSRLIGPYRFLGLFVCPLFFFEKFFSNVTRCFGS